jgi:hypothetical protein
VSAPASVRRPHREGNIMIKDIVANLSVGESRDVAADYAISVAETFGAHLAGVAFAYEPVIPGTIMGGMPADVIDASIRVPAGPAFHSSRGCSTRPWSGLRTCSDGLPGGSMFRWSVRPSPTSWRAKI